MCVCVIFDHLSEPMLTSTFGVMYKYTTLLALQFSVRLIILKTHAHYYLRVMVDYLTIVACWPER